MKDVRPSTQDPGSSAARLGPRGFSAGVVGPLGAWAIGGIGGICFWGVADQASKWVARWKPP